ncbi:DUF998 domain-containing protein [Microbacterium sp. C7(2022)]|uniref:DUF998 domain-containing protein n=1 Tax=Microbacterium sp. C7(2022) TaxID=2992759 RepID=UPI00237B4A52|nr:DUF998 domain-containing protein [Microbacterium sp. C7(2022)]MDE0546475.1 DUF998 domain-containing protein [Microbacterium sp. C7(2022)]
MSTPQSPTRRSLRMRVSATPHDDRERSLETLALGIGAVAFIVVGLVAIVTFRFADAPISGPGSVGQFAAIASGVAAFVAFIAGRYVVHDREAGHTMTVLDMIDVVALAFAHAIIALLSWTLLSVILEAGFIDATVFSLPLIILSATAGAVTAYLVFFSATHMDLQLLAIILASFLAEGVLTAMLTASDPHWWQENLSALGMTDDLSAMTFNLTLIVAGFIVTTLARYATRDIPTPHPTGLRNVRRCLIVVGVFLGLVGVFTVDEFFGIHTAVASGMVVAFATLVFGLRSWIPALPKAFTTLGYVFIAVIVLLAIFFAVGFYTLTAVELVAGILVFAWIVLFIRNSAALEKDARDERAASVASPRQGDA